MSDDGDGDRIGGTTTNGEEPPGATGRPNGGSPGIDGGRTGGPNGGPTPSGEEGDGRPPAAFEEVQRFRQRWLWAVVGVVSALSVVTVLARRPGPLLALVLLLVPAVGIPGTYFARLRTEVREDGLYVRLRPLHRSPRRVAFEEVTAHEPVEFRAFRDFGGIGIRRTPGGWAYVVESGGGVRIERGEGKPTVTVGSKRPGELDRAIAAGVARASATVGADDQPRWKAVANFEAEAPRGEFDPETDEGPEE